MSFRSVGTHIRKEKIRHYIMKKITLLLSLFLSFSSLVHAQWTTSGTVTTTTNSIGIGTTSPVQLLDVSGTGGPFSSTAKANALFVQDHTNYRGLYLGFDSSGQIGVLAACTNTAPSNLAFWNYRGAAGWAESMRITSDGNVGIGTTAPGAALSIVNSAPLIQLFDKESNPLDGSSEGKLAFGSAGNEWASMEAIRFTNTADDLTALKFKTSWATGAGGDGTNIERMRINFNGYVGIGTTNPQNKLDVNGTIHSKAVNIDLNGWSDYVFKKDYQLKPLSEVKNYIDQNQHLPEIPSEQQILKDGLNLGEMNKLLMKKVEELTLYLIEQDKKVTKQEVINEELRSRLNHLEQNLKH